MIKLKLPKAICITSIILLMVIFVIRYCILYRGLGVDEWRDYILSYGIIAPMIFVAIYTFLPITFFPASLLTIVAGLSFGVARGSFYTIIASLTGSTLAYFIASYFGKDVVVKLAGKKAQWIKSNIEGNGFDTILIMRLLPIVPFNIVSYSAGLAGISYTKYILATALGVLPEIFIYTYAGSVIIDGGIANIGVAITLLLVLTVITMIFKIWTFNCRKSNSTNNYL